MSLRVLYLHVYTFEGTSVCCKTVTYRNNIYCILAAKRLHLEQSW